jgi:hypothetical protein
LSGPFDWKGYDVLLIQRNRVELLFLGDEAKIICAKIEFGREGSGFSMSLIAGELHAKRSRNIVVSATLNLFHSGTLYSDELLDLPY